MFCYFVNVDLIVSYLIIKSKKVKVKIKNKKKSIIGE